MQVNTGVFSLTSIKQATAAKAFGSAGPIQVNMNKYHLGLETSAEEWTAHLSAPNAIQEGSTFLDTKNGKTVMVESLKVIVPCEWAMGWFIELLELAGGWEDGLGITIISGLVEAGSADNTGLLPDNSMSKIAVREADGTETAGRLCEMLWLRSNCGSHCFVARCRNGIVGCLDNQALATQTQSPTRLQYPSHQQEPDLTLELFCG